MITTKILSGSEIEDACAVLCDEFNNVIGKLKVLQNNLTVSKRHSILEDLEMVAPILPAPVYWHDINGVVLGLNEICLEGMGTARDKVIGKTPYDFYPKEVAEHILKHNEQVIRTKETLSQEETINNITTGKLVHAMAIKSPLYDDEGNVIGIVGTSIDITAEKEAERLKLESQEKFVKIANQVAHDIRSPLASLLMIIKSCTEIPEAERIALREAAINIGDIANHLLNQYQKKEPDAEAAEERQPILVCATLLQILTDKKYQYQNLPIKFEHNFGQDSHFCFIKIQPSAFKRMLSNLINNAVDALDKQQPKVDLKLDANKEWVKIIIHDNGKGMSPELVNKIMNNIAVTAHKQSGHGIGLTQVRETLQGNQGELSIDSTLGRGTTITLTFPRIETPDWIAEEISLGMQDIVIILDDDTSIHGAWDTHLEPTLTAAPGIRLKHFQAGDEALAFINTLSVTEKQHVFLLTDYELLKQELNGLHVVAKGQLKRSILVTSHYANPLVREQAAKTGTKILPKQLASEIPIRIDSATQKLHNLNKLKQVDLVIVDDNKNFVKSLANFVFSEQTVDTYYNPIHFLDNVSQYSKDTKICLDNNFDNSDLTGLEIARQLHDLGYTRLYLLSGEVFKTGDVPGYLTVIRKDRIERIKTLVD